MTPISDGPAIGASSWQENAEPLAASQSIDGKVALIDCCDTDDPGFLGQCNQRRVGVVTRQVCVSGNDRRKRRVISHRFDTEYSGGTRALEPNERSALMCGTRGENIRSLGHDCFRRKQLSMESAKPLYRCAMMSIGPIDESDDRSGVNECA